MRKSKNAFYSYVFNRFVVLNFFFFFLNATAFFLCISIKAMLICSWVESANISVGYVNVKEAVGLIYFYDFRDFFVV